MAKSAMFALIANILMVSLSSCKQKASESRVLDGADGRGSSALQTAQSNASSYSDPVLLEKIERVFLLKSSTLDLVGGKVAAEVVASPKTPAKVLATDLPEQGLSASRTSTAAFRKTFEINESPALPPRNTGRLDSGKIEGSADTPILVRAGKGDSLALEFNGKKLEYSHGSITAFSKNMERIEIEGVDKVSFKDGEDSAFVLVADSDALVKNIADSPNSSVIRGTAEFRILKKADGLTLIHALDIKPKLQVSNVNAKVNSGQVFLPAATFRSDAQFVAKQGFVQGLGAKLVELDKVSSGSVLSGSASYKYRVERSLGEGSYGTVYLVKVEASTGEQFSLAIKQPNANIKMHPISPLTREDVVDEIAYLDAMSRNPSGMQLYGAYPISKGHYNIAMEVVDGDWSGAIAKGIDFDSQTRIMIGAGDGYGAMHAAGMVHYDTKSANLFYTGQTAKIGDFGFARLVNGKEIPDVDSHGTFVPFDLKDLGPSSIPGDPYKVDTFALGIAMLEMRLQTNITRQMHHCCASPASGRQWYVIDGDALFNRFEADLPIKERGLFESMLSNDPALRPASLLEVSAKLREIHGISNI